MHYCFNTLRIVLCAYLINGLNQHENIANESSIISIEKAKHNTEHTWLTKEENVSDTLAANTLKNHQRGVSKRSEDEGKVKRPKQDDGYSLTKFINKFVKKENSSPFNIEFNQGPSVNKIMNRQILNDLISDNVYMPENKTGIGNYKENVNQNNSKYEKENLSKATHLKQNKNYAIFETPTYDSEDKNQTNVIKEAIKNRQPIYKSKNQLKCLTDLKKRISKPLQEKDVITNVLNTQNFITNLRKTLPGGKNSKNIRNDNIIRETPKCIHKRFASMMSGSEKNHKKKKLHKPGVDASNSKKGSTTKKVLDDNEFISVESMPIAVDKVQRKPKLGDVASETTFQCIVSCKFQTTTTSEITTTTCSSPTTTTTTCSSPTTTTTTCPSPTTKCETTTVYEPLTPCQVSETTCEEPTSECKTPTTTECFCPTKKVTKKCRTSCSTRSTTIADDVDEEDDCEAENNQWPTTGKCKTDQCDESDIINDDGSDE